MNVLKDVFAKFAPVTSLELERGTTVGHVRFKKGVAKDVVGFAQRQGGVMAGDEQIEVEALEGMCNQCIVAVANRTQFPGL